MSQSAFEMMKASAQSSLPIQSAQLAHLESTVRHALLQGLQAFMGAESDQLESFITAVSAGREDAYHLLTELSEEQILPLREAIAAYREHDLSEVQTAALKLLFNLIEGHCFYYYVSE